MHSKNKGNIGELCAAKELSRLGYNVFRELGDLSKIDLIAEKDLKLIRFQVKAITPTKEVLQVKSSKSGPNYKFKYQDNMVDIFSIYDLENDKIYWISSNELLAKSMLSLRLVIPKNNQYYNVNWAKNYFDLNIALEKQFGSEWLKNIADDVAKAKDGSTPS